MINPDDLALTREWAEWVHGNPKVYGWTSDRARAAADLISSLPDTIVDGDKLREILSGIENGDYDVQIGRGVSGIRADLEALLPAPPAPPTMAEIEWDDDLPWEVGDVAHDPDAEDMPDGVILVDADGDAWRRADGQWQILLGNGPISPRREWGPYEVLWLPKETA